MTTKLFERLVTKFSIKVTDLIKYLDISKATIYNYRNLDSFDNIPKDKQYKILYLFGKENVSDLELVLDESDADVLNGYINRIASIFKESIKEKKDSLSSVEELSIKIDKLLKENAELQRDLLELNKLQHLDNFTKSIFIDKIASITKVSSTAEVKEFIDYLDIFEKYRSVTK